MPRSTELRNSVTRLINEALNHLPDTRPKDLPPTELIPEASEWHSFEHELWKLGEEVRSLISEKVALRRDLDLYSCFFSLHTSPVLYGVPKLQGCSLILTLRDT